MVVVSWATVVVGSVVVVVRRTVVVVVFGTVELVVVVARWTATGTVVVVVVVVVGMISGAGGTVVPDVNSAKANDTTFSAAATRPASATKMAMSGCRLVEESVFRVVRSPITVFRAVATSWMSRCNGWGAEMLFRSWTDFFSVLSVGDTAEMRLAGEPCTYDNDCCTMVVIRALAGSTAAW